jgi:Tol biopolymer transport system component
MDDRHQGNRREVRRRAARPRSGAAIGTRALTLIVVVVALVVAMASVASAHPQRTSGRSAGQPQWILFTALKPGSFGAEQIFRVQQSGKGLKQLTNGAYPAEAPAFSPDGKQVAFVRVGVGIFSMNINGSGLHALTRNSRDSYPAWSPDGKQIAFIRPIGSAWKVYVMSASGAGQRQLRQSPPAGRPSWTSRGLVIPTDGDLAKIDPRTGQVQKLFGALIDATTGVDTTGVSANLSTLTFVGARPPDPGDTGCGDGVPCQRYSLFLQDLHPKAPPRTLVLNGGPATFSPDGKRLVFVSGDRLTLRRVTGDGETTSIKTGKLSLTTSTPPVWQPR